MSSKDSTTTRLPHWYEPPDYQEPGNGLVPGWNPDNSRRERETRATQAEQKQRAYEDIMHYGVADTEFPRPITKKEIGVWISIAAIALSALVATHREPNHLDAHSVANIDPQGQTGPSVQNLDANPTPKQ